MKPDSSAIDKPPAAGRPRDPRIDAAILQATAELLVQIGYPNLTLAAVAERAGTTKSALYRRWSSKAELVHEAVFPVAPIALASPAGDIAADIRAMIGAARDVFTSPVVRAALPGLIADMDADAELNTRVMSRFAGLFDAVRLRLGEAIDRGEVYPDVDPDRLVEVIGGATLLRLLLRLDDELGDNWVDQTTAIVVHGVSRCDGIAAMPSIQPFPDDWRSALVLVPHPDDPEYGMAAAVAKWTAAGKTVRYALACRGEAGIAGMPPERAGPVREAEQRRSAAIVGVHPVDGVDFWDFPDSEIRNTAELRAKIAAIITEAKPDVVVTIYGGPQWAPGAPNQRDHIEFAAAVTAAYDELPEPARWLFQVGLQPTHAETVDDFIEVAVRSLAAHDAYLSVLDPQTPVAEQARRVVDMVTSPRPELGGRRAVGFILIRGGDR